MTVLSKRPRLASEEAPVYLQEKRYLPRHTWYLPEAQVLLRGIQAAMWPLQRHACLGGGVLNHGYSNKDLDIYILPLYVQDTARPLDCAVVAALNDALGTTPVMDYARAGQERSLGHDAGSHTCFEQSLRYVSQGRAIDVFIVRP
jgi:hypothetical protein